MVNISLGDLKMCKFCEDKNGCNILWYSNRSSMNVYCGQYQGVGANASLNMIGNMLELHANGSYRSQSDCYYESEGLEIDDKYSANAKPSYMKISYCPFCGRKLESKIFEKTILQDQIQELEVELQSRKEKLNKLHICIRFDWNYPGKKITIYDLSYCDERYKNGMKEQSVPINTLLERGAKVSCEMHCGNIHPGFGAERKEEFDFEKEVECTYCWWNKYETDWYYTNEKTLNKLQKLGLINRISRKDIKEMNAKREEIIKEITAFENKINELNEKLKSKNY